MSAGKGDKPRNCFSSDFKDNYDLIDWKNTRRNKVQKAHGTLILGDSYTCHACNSKGEEMLVLEELKAIQPKEYRESMGFYFIKCRTCKGTTKVSYEKFKQQLGIA
jgi:hypothetical protein